MTSGQEGEPQGVWGESRSQGKAEWPGLCCHPLRVVFFFKLLLIHFGCLYILILVKGSLQFFRTFLKSSGLDGF